MRAMEILREAQKAALHVSCCYTRANVMLSAAGPLLIQDRWVGGKVWLVLHTYMPIGTPTRSAGVGMGSLPSSGSLCTIKFRKIPGFQTHLYAGFLE